MLLKEIVESLSLYKKWTVRGGEENNRSVFFAENTLSSGYTLSSG